LSFYRLPASFSDRSAAPSPRSCAPPMEELASKQRVQEPGRRKAFQTEGSQLDKLL
jgi:hypothetical protein